MITLSNDHRLQYIATSGSLGFAGIGYMHEQPLRWLGLLDPSLFDAIIIKTLTYNRTKGNLKTYWPFGCIRLLFDGLLPCGTVNAVGLTNPGYVWWMHDVAPKVYSGKLKIIASFKADTLDELSMMAQSFNMVDTLVAVQWNVSCPNTKDRDELLRNEDFIVNGCTVLKRISAHPVLLKLSEQHSMNLVRRLEGLVEAIEPNSVRWDRIYPNRKSPLAHLGGGGVSGKPAQRHNWTFLKFVRHCSSIPIIGNDIWEYEDLGKLDELGVSAYSFGSLFIPYPWRPTRYVRRHIKEGRTDGTKAVAADFAHQHR